MFWNRFLKPFSGTISGMSLWMDCKWGLSQTYLEPMFSSLSGGSFNTSYKHVTGHNVSNMTWWAHPLMDEQHWMFSQYKETWGSWPTNTGRGFKFTTKNMRYFVNQIFQSKIDCNYRKLLLTLDHWIWTKKHVPFQACLDTTWMMFSSCRFVHHPHPESGWKRTRIYRK